MTPARILSLVCSLGACTDRRYARARGRDAVVLNLARASRHTSPRCLSLSPHTQAQKIESPTRSKRTYANTVTLPACGPGSNRAAVACRTHRVYTTRLAHTPDTGSRPRRPTLLSSSSLYFFCYSCSYWKSKFQTCLGSFPRIIFSFAIVLQLMQHWLLLAVLLPLSCCCCATIDCFGCYCS